MTSTVTTHTSDLLADPAAVALLRDLYAHARTARTEHAIYPGDDSPSGASYPTEHTWTADHQKVSVHGDCLVFESHGKVLLSAAGVDGVRKGADLLAAIGVLPPRFISGGVL